MAWAGETDLKSCMAGLASNQYAQPPPISPSNELEAAAIGSILPTRLYGQDERRHFRL